MRKRRRNRRLKHFGRLIWRQWRNVASGRGGPPNPLGPLLVLGGVPSALPLEVAFRLPVSPRTLRSVAPGPLRLGLTLALLDRRVPGSGPERVAPSVPRPGNEAIALERGNRECRYALPIHSTDAPLSHIFRSLGVQPVDQKVAVQPHSRRTRQPLGLRCTAAREPSQALPV